MLINNRDKLFESNMRYIIENKGIWNIYNYVDNYCYTEK